MSYSIMKEFNCKVSSAWCNDDRTKDTAFTLRKHTRRCRNWTVSLGQTIDMMTALSTMKENCGTREISTRFTQGYRKEEMVNNSWEKEERIGVDEHPRRWNIKSNL